MSFCIKINKISQEEILFRSQEIDKKNTYHSYELIIKNRKCGIDDTFPIPYDRANDREVPKRTIRLPKGEDCHFEVYGIKNLHCRELIN